MKISWVMLDFIKNLETNYLLYCKARCFFPKLTHLFCNDTSAETSLAAPVFTVKCLVSGNRSCATLKKKKIN